MVRKFTLHIEHPGTLEIVFDDKINKPKHGTWYDLGATSFVFIPKNAGKNKNNKVKK